MSKKLLVGLGNPGEDYETTRHNLGKEIVEEIAAGKNLKWTNLGYGRVARGENTTFFIPETFMNNSGVAVAKIMQQENFAPLEMVIVRDDLDMELGKVRGVVFNSGPGGHNGVISVLEELGGSDFGQVKVGIGRPDTREEIDDYVLGHFEEDEREIIDKAKQEAKERINEWTGDEE